MNFSIMEVDDGGLFPELPSLILTLAFLLAITVAARRIGPRSVLGVWIIGSVVGIAVALFVRLSPPCDLIVWQFSQVSVRVILPTTLVAEAVLLWPQRTATATGALATGSLAIGHVLSVRVAEAWFPGLYIS